MSKVKEPSSVSRRCRPSLPPDDGRRLAERHAVAEGGEPDPGGQPADAGPDHDDTSHPFDSTCVVARRPGG